MEEEAPQDPRHGLHVHRVLPVRRLPVPHHPRTTGTATGANPAVVARAFAELWRMRREGVVAPGAVAAPPGHDGR